MARNGRNTTTTTTDIPADVIPDAPEFDATVVPDTDAIPAATDAVIAAYRSGTVAEKARIRAAWDRAMRSALTDADFPRAAAINGAMAGMVSAPARSTAPVDYTAIVRDRAMSLFGAAYAVMMGDIRPAGIPDDAVIDYAAIGEMSVRDMVDAFGNTPSDSDVVRNGNAIAAARVTRSTDRRDIGAIIVAAFDGRPAGTFMSVADIRRAYVAANPNDDYVPGDGAIAARLFPANGACTVPGITPVDATATNVRGAHN